MHHHSKKESIGRFTRRMGETILDYLHCDLTETRYGHRVLDQIFREGKFAPKGPKAPGSKGKHK